MPSDYFANILSPSSTEVKRRDYTHIGVVYARKTMQTYQQTHAQRVGIGFLKRLTVSVYNRCSWDIFDSLFYPALFPH